MKCPICKAWALVKETRNRADGSTYRRYECANLHRFSTSEKPLETQAGMTYIARQPAIEKQGTKPGTKRDV